MSIETNNAIGAYNAALKQLHETQGNSSDTGGATDFSKMVKNFAESAVEVGKKSEIQSAAAAAGQADLNTVVMAVTEAELTLNTVVAVRDKVLESYREILRMPI